MLFIHDVEKSSHVFICSKLDYSNALLTGIPTKSIKKYKVIQNATTRLQTWTKLHRDYKIVVESCWCLRDPMTVPTGQLLLFYAALIRPEWALAIFLHSDYLFYAHCPTIVHSLAAHFLTSYSTPLTGYLSWSPQVFDPIQVLHLQWETTVYDQHFPSPRS